MIDLSPYIPTPYVKITHIVTELDEDHNPIYHSDDIVSATSVKIDETPVFVELVETSESPHAEAGK